MLAKLQEDKLEDRHRSYHSRILNNPPPPPLLPQTPQPTPKLPALLPPPIPSPKAQVKRLTAKELAHKREHGLCYNCDDKWSPSHICKARFFLSIVEDEEATLDPHPQPPHNLNSPTTPDATRAQISFNALTGMPHSSLPLYNTHWWREYS